MENLTLESKEHQLLAETEKEVSRLKIEITNKENELHALRLALGQAAIKLQNHKPVD